MNQRRRQGFTLVELMVVILIIALLLSILVPAGQTVVEAARRTKCSANLKELGVALASYHTTKGHYPIGIIPPNSIGGRRVMASWTFHTRLLQYLGHEDLVEHMDFTENCFVDNRAREDKKGVPSIPLEVMQCPSDSRHGETHTNNSWGTYAVGNYFGVIGTTARKKDGMLFSTAFPVRDSDVTDGEANTIFLGERGNVDDLLYGWWACGTGDNNDGEGDNLLTTERGLTPGTGDHVHRLHFWSEHVAGGGNFLYVSGKVEWHSYDIDYHLLQALATRAGNDNSGESEFDIDDNILSDGR